MTVTRSTLSADGVWEPALPRVSRSDELLALAERLELAEPDRHFDIVIAETVFNLEARPYSAGKRKLWWYERGTDNIKFYGEESIPRYANSIDAAVTLVPQGWVWYADNLAGPVAHVIGPEDDEGRVPEGLSDTGLTKTVALAFCAAALRARAALAKHHSSLSVLEGEGK